MHTLHLLAAWPHPPSTGDLTHTFALKAIKQRAKGCCIALLVLRAAHHALWQASRQLIGNVGCSIAVLLADVEEADTQPQAPEGDAPAAAEGAEQGSRGGEAGPSGAQDEVPEEAEDPRSIQAALQQKRNA